MSAAVAKVAKPNMAFIQARSLYKHIFIGMGVAGAAGFAFQKLYIEPFDKATEEFYSTYNPWEDFERMRNLGLFQSAPPDYILKERAEKKKLKEQQKRK